MPSVCISYRDFTALICWRVQNFQDRGRIQKAFDSRTMLKMGKAIKSAGRVLGCTIFIHNINEEARVGNNTVKMSLKLMSPTQSHKDLH